jgi:MFS family permease
MEKMLTRLLYGIIGAFLGFIAGGILAYPIALLITPKGQDAAFAFVFIFALITSQLGMILGPCLAMRILERRKTRQNKQWSLRAAARNSL